MGERLRQQLAVDESLISSVCEYVRNEHALGPVVHPGDQPVVIAVNIEHGTSTHNIRMCEFDDWSSEESLHEEAIKIPVSMDYADQFDAVVQGQIEE